MVTDYEAIKDMQAAAVNVAAKRGFEVQAVEVVHDIGEQPRLIVTFVQKGHMTPVPAPVPTFTVES